MNRLVPAVVAACLGLSIGVAGAPPAHASGLTSCSSYYKVKNISCRKAAPVVEEGLARLLDQNARVVHFDGWTCKRKGTDTRRFTCTRKAQLVRYLG